LKPDLGYQRERMVLELLAGRGIRDQRVLDAMRSIPRHRFLKEHLRARAYGDHALPIGEGQTISQPYVVARMSELLDVRAESTVLEIGAGSGYQTAVLAHLARWVYSLERIPELTRSAIRMMRELGLKNVKIQQFDGTVGWSQFAPFDRILVTAGAPRVPEPLLSQLAAGGILLIPEGDKQEQHLVTYRSNSSGMQRNVHEPAAFVPLIGRHGWQED